jgi:hypothetical protein
MPPRLGCALNATEVHSSRRNLNLVYTQVNENTFLIETLRPIRKRGQVRPADEAARCPGGSLFGDTGEPCEVAPISYPGPVDPKKQISGSPKEIRDEKPGLAERDAVKHHCESWGGSRSLILASRDG